jgi:hypothetical protein
MQDIGIGKIDRDIAIGVQLSLQDRREQVVDLASGGSSSPCSML